MSNEHYAYGPEWADVETVMRLHAVKRWHMIDTTRVQTLAEHSANVATLVFGIVRSCPGMYFGNALNAAGAALIHDIDEVFTGDIPTHTKRKLQGVEELERTTTPQVFRHDTKLFDPRLAELIKICDLCDGIRFIRLHGVDVTAKHAREGLEAQLHQLREKVRGVWPGDVFMHVGRWTAFYAYENS